MPALSAKPTVNPLRPRRPCLPRACAAFAVVVAVFHPLVSRAERLRVEVRETRGLARGGYPASVLLELPRPVDSKTRFRLADEGQVVPAQFRPASHEARTDRFWLDFTVQLAPLETRNFTVEYGDSVEASPEPKQGHELRQTDDAFIVANAPYIAWTVPRDLRGLLTSVDFPPSEHLLPDSPGLVVRDRKGREHRLGGEGVTAEVVRHGRLAVALRFKGRLTEPSLTDVRYEVELTFPSPVSWVEATCRVEDPRDRIAAVGASLNLALDAPASGTPTLVDFGGDGWVYASLYAGQVAKLVKQPASRDGIAAPACKVFAGPEKEQQLLAVARTGLPAQAIEGWVHAMDRKRCLALAVADFAHWEGKST